LKRVRQFSYERFSDTDVGGRVKSKLTQSQRYSKALRATQLIASELADIDEEDEFRKMLDFVMQQWRNVRQKTSEVTSPLSQGAPGKRKVIQVVKDEDPDSSDEFKDAAMHSEGQSSHDDLVEDVLSTAPKIRLNPKARKVGRPKKVKAKAVAGEKADRKWFEASEAGRKTAGDTRLAAVPDNLDREQPGLREIQRRLAGVLVKFAEADGKKPKFKRQKNPVLIQDAFYVLPPKLLDACMAVLPVSNTHASAIEVDEATQGPTPSQVTTETVHIKDVGTFSRKQIEIFKRCQNLKNACDLGIDMHKWLIDDGLPSLPAQYHDVAKEVARDIMESYPFKELENLPRLADYTYTLLYRLTPPTWLTDTALRACCERLVMDNNACRFAGLQTTSTSNKRTRSKDAEPVVATGPPTGDDEEKQPPPSQDQDEEQLPATQVAQ
jgi:hypothetical protein